MNERPMPAGVALPDEDALILPDAWRARIHPRRGGLPVPVAPVAAERADEPAARIGTCEEVVATLLEGAGTAAVPLLAHHLDRVEKDHREVLLAALSVIPSDAAFQTLVDRIGDAGIGTWLAAALGRFPARGLRLLAPVVDAGSANAERATDLVRRHAALAAAVLPGLPDNVQNTVGPLLEKADRVPDAPAKALPPILVAPPWTVRRTRPKQVVLNGLPRPAETSIAWEPGERERWAETADELDPRGGRWTDWEEAAHHFPSMHWYLQPRFLLHAPIEVARPLLSGWEPKYEWDSGDWARAAVARFELGMLPIALRMVEANVEGAAGALLPFRDGRVASLMARTLTRRKARRKHAVAWFERHGTAAVPHLLPAALGKAGAGRRDAEAALRLVASRHGTGAVPRAITGIARVHGDEAAAAIEALLTTDPLEILPAKMPVPGDWADPEELPQILLARRPRRALPAEAVRHLFTMLAISKPGEPYPGLDLVREACDRGSLAEFSWAVFQRWRRHGEMYGSPGKDEWALAQLGRLGDDETVRRLTPVIRSETRSGRTNAGLDALVDIGSDVALMHLHGIALKGRSRTLRARAQERVDRIAAERELTPERLADRLVPDFGLDADGGLTLDYGPRRFAVGFDERLMPQVKEEDGTPRKALPRPSASDDRDLASAAYQRFAALKKDVKAVAGDQILRLETALVTRRRWPAGEFRALFAEHPLVWHIARRLVWTIEGGGSFRIAEDRTFADVTDTVLDLPRSATVGIAHPLDLAGGPDAWAEVFADYEIVQPFEQLGRPVHTLRDEERAAGRLKRFEGLRLPTARTFGLREHIWRREQYGDGFQSVIWREAAPGRYVVIRLDPGVPVADAVDSVPEQRLEGVFVSDRKGLRAAPGPDARFGALDPVTASEILADLTRLTE
ncbi:hypothetical protein GCM10010191_86290 [Actinomadura vinacea]|uniref:DUF4132 domain-containing protein n=1 Tax=Actinomadura vinacea TaxID=115336 RepID=A0ABN3KE20_9ACTN